MFIGVDGSNSAYYNGETGVDAFMSGDLEINNEGYNNPGVMVSFKLLLN